MSCTSVNESIIAYEHEIPHIHCSVYRVVLLLNMCLRISGHSDQVIESIRRFPPQPRNLTEKHGIRATRLTPNTYESTYATPNPHSQTYSIAEARECTVSWSIRLTKCNAWFIRTARGCPTKCGSSATVCDRFSLSISASQGGGNPRKVMHRPRASS